MKILFDQGTPVPLRVVLAEYVVDTAFELGWQTLRNGELLAQAELNSYDLLITTDQNLRYQQNLEERTIAIIVLRTTSWPRIKGQSAAILDAVKRITPNGYIEVEIPLTAKRQ